MEVLLWLVPAGVVTLLACGWASWAARRERLDASDDRRRSPADDEAARARLGAALAKPLPHRAHHVEPQRVDRATGVAVRRDPMRN